MIPTAYRCHKKLVTEGQITLYQPCTGLHGGHNVQRSLWQRISSVHSLWWQWQAFHWSQGETHGGA